MAKPVIQNISPFDVNKGATITFTYSGDKDICKVKAVICDAETSAKVFEEKIDNRIYNYTIPKTAGLTNGKQYTITIQCFDEDDTGSTTSEKRFFYCLSTPTFRMLDLSLDKEHTIGNSNYTAVIYYSQKENEKLLQTKFYIYTADKELISNSSVMYSPNNLEYNYTSLSDAHHYYLRATGQTENGIDLDTGYIQIFVRYYNPTSYALIYANQDDNNTGTVNYWTNISVIRPEHEGYTIKDSTIDLTGTSIVYSTGYSFPDNFTFAIKHKLIFGKLLELRNAAGQTIVLSLISTAFGNKYKLRIDDYYDIYSDTIDYVYDNADFITVYIRKRNNIYGFKTFSELDYKLKDYPITISPDGIAPLYPEKFEVWFEGFKAGEEFAYMDDTDITLADEEPTGLSYGAIWIGGDE